MAANALAEEVSSPRDRQEQVEISQAVEFDRDILPIFRDRCFACHSAQRVEGDLRLDVEALARKGGHTGQPVLGTSSSSSELFNRIVSTEAGYKMPSKGEPLDSQQIQLIKLWLDQGSQWGGHNLALNANQVEQPKPENQTGQKSGQSVFERLVAWMLDFNNSLSKPKFKYFGIVYWLTLSLGMLFILKLAVIRGKKPTKVKSGISNFLSWQRLLILLIATAGIGIIQFQQGRIDELKNEVTRMERASRKQPPIVLTTDRNKLAMPSHPQHPPRLGGEYYRGNDERDPDLFNGGFYRTATMSVSLVDSKGNKLEWGNSITAQPMAIELKIERAPGTTMQLFNERIFAETYVRRFRETGLLNDSTRDESEPFQFQNVIPEKVWKVTIPLEKSEDWVENRNAGVAYVFYGSQMENGFKGRAHYGIRFDLRIVDGKISPESQIWMGSLYDLGGRVLVPQDRELLLDHWFDFRPIPEIEGNNTDDRTLLGIPEHEDAVDE